MESFRTHARVVHALVLRDIKTRAGGSYFGFLFGLIMPLGHIGLVLLIYIMLGRKSPMGTDTVLFLASAIIPFVVWSYTHQKMILSFGQNRPLMTFPIVGIAEIAISRAIVEILTATLIIIITSLAMWLIGVEMIFYDNKLLLVCMFFSYIFGVSTGLIVGVASIINQIYALAGFLLMPLFWMTSGVFFTPDALPEFVRITLSVFVLSHIVDLSRIAIYPGYISSYPNIEFLVAAILFNFIVAAVMIRVLKVSLSTP